MDVYRSKHLVVKQSRSASHVGRREATLNLKRGENERVSKTTCSVKEKDKRKPTSVERRGSRKPLIKQDKYIHTINRHILENQACRLIISQIGQKSFSDNVGPR